MHYLWSMVRLDGQRMGHQSDAVNWKSGLFYTKYEWLDETDSEPDGSGLTFSLGGNAAVGSADYLLGEEMTNRYARSGSSSRVILRTFGGERLTSEYVRVRSV